MEMGDSSFKMVDSSKAGRTNRVPNCDDDLESKGLLWLSGPLQDTGGRERLKRHRDEVAGQVAIPETWGQESFLRDWVDHPTFDTLLAPKGISSAREALMAEGRRAASQGLRMESRCC